MLSGNPATKCAGVNDLQINWMNIIRLALTALLGRPQVIINALELQTPKVALNTPAEKPFLAGALGLLGNPGLLGPSTRIRNSIGR